MMTKKEKKNIRTVNSTAQKEESAETKQPAETEAASDGKVSQVQETEDTRAAEEVCTEEELSEEEKLRARVEELEDKLLRLAAEFDNYKKRIARQYDDMARAAGDRIFLELLEVVDNFERALQHGNENSDAESFRKGTELIFSQLMALLEKHGVRPIEAVGKPFDPNVHEAMMQVESQDYPDGIVAVEMSKGYTQDKRVLRHSKVGVSKGKPEKGREGQSEQNDKKEQTK